MNEWIDFYDSTHSIYVSPLHRDVHFELIARDIAAYVTSPEAVVIDYSCGEALVANRVADLCGKLILAEPAPGVRERITKRFSGNPSIEVCSLDDLRRRPPGSIDLVVMNSVAQYMTLDELNAAFGECRRLLRPTGRLVLGDIVRPDVGPLTDAMALLRLAASRGFLIDALTGLVRTALSDYRRIRSRVGLSTYTETAMLDILRAAKFSATRASNNIGYNPARMTFVATPA